jgi:hypothetical protein
LAAREDMLEFMAWKFWDDDHAPLRAHKVVHSKDGSMFSGMVARHEDTAVTAVYDAGRCCIALVGTDAGAHAADDGSQFWGLRKHRDESWGFTQVVWVDIEAEEAGRVDLAKTLEKGMVGDMVIPAFADEGRPDEGGGEGDADKDLDEEVIIVEHLGCRHGNLRCGTLSFLAIVYACFLLGMEIDPAK